MDGDLDLGDAEVSPYVQAQIDADGHRFRVSGLLVDTDGQGTLSDAFGDVPGGSQVQTSLDFFAMVGNYSYELLREEHYRVGVGAQLGFYSLDVSATAVGSRESLETQGLLPMPYAEVEVEFYNKDGKYTAPNDYMVCQTIKSDANGVFTYAAPKAGWWGFAALSSADFKLKHNGTDKDVEIGAVIWVKFHDWQQR